jgi:uncharacterized protein (UPF0332 family)
LRGSVSKRPGAPSRQRAGELDPRFHRWLLAAFRERQEATYDVDAQLTAEQADTLISRAEEFLAAARNHLGLEN